jgi:hypothetical protein
MPVKMYTIAPNFRVNITPRQMLIGGCVIAGTFLTLWLAKKTHSTYKAYAIKKQEEKQRYEMRLDNCLPTPPPLPLAAIGQQAQTSALEGITLEHLEKFFNTICFDDQQSEQTSFETMCQKANDRIVLFEKHCFLHYAHKICIDNGNRLSQLHNMLCKEYRGTLQAFALLKGIEGTKKIKLIVTPLYIPANLRVTTTPGIDLPQESTADFVVRRLCNNKYIAAADYVYSIIERIDTLQKSYSKIDLQPSTKPTEQIMLEEFSTSIFEQIDIYKNTLLDVHAALIQNPLYIREIELRNQERELAARIEAERQRTQAIEKQAEATRQHTYAMTKQAIESTAATMRHTEALRQHTAAQEEHNRLERTRLHHTPQQGQRHFVPQF